jgi:ATP-dependent DNA helicase RecG
MPLSPEEFQRRKVAEGVIDWSAEITEGIKYQDLSPIEIARLRNTLKARKPDSDLTRLSDKELLKALGILRREGITRAGALFLCDGDLLKEKFPQHEAIYLYQSKETEIKKRENLKLPLLAILEKLTEFIEVRNLTRTLKVGLFHIDIPSYPEETFREAILNALCHRNYLEPGSVYIRHTSREMVISNPGGFIGGITPYNILVYEPKQRNRHLAEILEKIGLVERAGIGRRRIFVPMLSYGKKAPSYEADEHTVKLTLYDESFDEKLAFFIAKKQREGFEFSLPQLLLLSYMRKHTEIDVPTFSKICQHTEAAARDILEQASLPPYNLLEKRGKKKGVSYYLSKNIAEELIGKVAYTKIKGIERHRYRELILNFIKDHGSISNTECRELLSLGDSNYASVKASEILRKLCQEGILKPVNKGRARRYYLRKNLRGKK